MINIQQIRQKYPQYQDLSDQELADKLHDKYYSDLPKEDFYGRIGLSTQPQTQMPQQQPIVQQQAQQSSLADTLAQSAPVQGILGAGDAMARALSAGLLKPKLGEGLPYQVGEVGGDILSFMAPGGAARSLLRAGEALPMVGEAAEFLGGKGLGGVTRRLLGSTAFGAATAGPDERLKGAGLGGALGAVGEALPAIAGGVAKVSKYVRPQQVVDDIISSHSPEMVAQKTVEGNDLYNRVFSNLGNRSVYDRTLETLPATGKETALPGKQYLSLEPDEVSSVYNRDLKLLHNRFLENPTLQNAHELQSQLGTEIRDLNKMKIRLGALPQADRNVQISYKYARNALQSDINDFLQNTEPTLAQQYKEATANWAKNVIPAREASLVINKLGPNPTPQKIISAFDKAEKRGFDIPEDLQNKLDTLESRTKAKEIAQKAAGLTLGAAATSHLPFAMEALGSAGGLFLTPTLMRGLGKIFGGAGSTLADYIGRSYRPIYQATLANILSNRGNQ